MIYALHNGARVANIIDHKAAPLSQQQYLDALGDDSMMLEPATLEEIEATYLYGLDGRGEQAFTDAIVTTHQRIDRTMAAFNRALNQALTGTEIQASDAKVGPPKKAGAVAVLSAEIPLSDGQSIFVIFHSPSNDPGKIAAADTLVAFRFLLNKRDVTHVVAPSKGRDISLKQTTLSLANLAERNSTKFAAKQADNKAKAEELATLEADTDQQMKQADLLSEQVDTLADAKGSTDAELAKVNGQLASQVQRNEELRQKLIGMKFDADKQPEPEITPPQPTPGDDAKGALVTLQNLPRSNVGAKLGGFTVLTATDRLIDVTPGTPGVAAKRYTWDGKGFKNRGQYLLTDGGTIPMEQVNKDTIKLDDLPEDGLRYVKQQLSIHGQMTLTNGAVISRRYADASGDLEGYISIVDKDGTVYRNFSTSSQGGAMDDAASVLYKAYKSGKAAGYRLKEDNFERNRELIKNALAVFITGRLEKDWRSSFSELGEGGEGDPIVPVLMIDTPAIDEQFHDGFYIKANVGPDNEPAGSFAVIYGDGGPITGATEVRHWDEAKAAMDAAYQKDVDEAFAKRNPQPVEPTPTTETVEEPAEATPLYWYGMRIRPYGLSTQPDGVIAHIPQDDVASDPRVADLIKDRDPTGWRHGMIAYLEPLTQDQIDHYSLEDMATAVWSPVSRAARLAELEEVVGRMVELEQSDEEIWGDLFMPKGSLTETNNPFFVDGKYESGQLTQALQEAGYTGSVKAMANSIFDKARTAAIPPVTEGDELPPDGGTEQPGDEPPVTSNQWDEADPTILALLEQLEALRTGESNYQAYLEAMGSLIEQLEQAGAVERHEPYLHKVADRLTELMEEAA